MPAPGDRAPGPGRAARHLTAAPAPPAGPPGWPTTARDLEATQTELAGLASRAPPWEPAPVESLGVAGVFAAFPTGQRGVGAAGDPAWAAAALFFGGKVLETAVVRGRAGAPYRPGLLALQRGPLLEAAVRALGRTPDLLLVNATGRDHPRGAGLALQLGVVLDVPTVGVTDHPLEASAGDPGPERGDRTPLALHGEPVGFLLRTRRRARAVAVHAAWRTDPETAYRVVLAVTTRARTPDPLRLARWLARVERARDEGRLPEERVRFPRWAERA